MSPDRACSSVRWLRWSSGMLAPILHQFISFVLCCLVHYLFLAFPAPPLPYTAYMKVIMVPFGVYILAARECLHGK